jgi:hypothetical protein
MVSVEGCQKFHSMIQAKLHLLSNKSLVVGFHVTVFSLILTTPTHAYLDPGTASILLQGLLGGLAVAIASVSFFWRRIWFFLTGNKREKSKEEQTNEQESD